MQTVLVVDDDKDLRDMIASHLEKAGFAVRIADNGADAMAMIDAINPALVITDLVMPGTDGMELIVNLRRQGETLPIIAVSGGGIMKTDTYLTAAEALGANAILSKPFRASQLLDLVQEQLGTVSAP